MTAPSISSWLAGARETIAKATPGPLKYDLHRPRTGFSLVTQAVHIADVMESNSHLPREEALANAEKLIRGWNALPALCDVVEAASRMNRAEFAFDEAQPNNFQEWDAATAELHAAKAALDAALLALASVPRG